MCNEQNVAVQSRKETDQTEREESGAERREKIDAVQVQCSPVNNRADTGGQEGAKHASATRRAG